MNLRRWLPRRAPLIVATLAITAAAVIPSAPASASVPNIFCTMSLSGPTGDAVSVSAGAFVTCNDLVSAINLSLDIARDGVIVASTLGGGSNTPAAGVVTGTTCVPGNYVATAWATVWYPFGNIPGAESIQRQSSTLHFSCTVTPTPVVVANPGNRQSFIADPELLQMTATGGTPPYTWSATGLPTGLSINSSTGQISGRTTRNGSFSVTVTAVDAAGLSGRAQFTWTVRRDACPRC